MKRFPLLILFLALVSIFSATEARAQDLGRVSPASLPLPVPTTAPLPPDQLRNNNPWNLRMVGTWRFSLTHGHVAIGGQYVSEESGSTTLFASSNEPKNPPQNAFDGDSSTRWCASDITYPQWLAADLGTIKHVTGVTINWERPTDHYTFQVQGSLDKKTWTTVSDMTAAPGVGDGPATVNPGDFRFIRIYVTGDSNDGWASIRELQIHYSDTSGQDVVWQAPPTPKPDNSEAALDAFASPSYDDTTWDNVIVPSNWEMRGYSLPTYGSVDNTVGEYRRVVVVPSAWTGRRIYWRFDGALDGAEIYVNGQKAGYHESGYTAFDVDVTGLVQTGKANLFAVRVSKSTPSDDCETGDFQCMGGIYRETSLISVPQTHVADITVRTPLDDQYKNATLNLSLRVLAPPGSAVSVAGKLVKSDGSATGCNVSGHAIAGSDGSATIPISTPVIAPALWSAEKPNLYYVLLNLSRNGRPVERVEQRFGFKQIEIKNHIVLWNGMPIKCNGTCRHDFWADKGFALSDTEWNKDLTLMKAANINAIRTSHYNHAERFLELCEEKGIYILDEVPYCWIGDSVKDPAYAPYLLQRAAETLARDKNRPCVLAWSIGNENPMGPDSQEVIDQVKLTDPTRPAFVSCQNPGDVKLQDWADEHYPGPDGVDGDAKNFATMTYNYSEHPHIFYQKETQDYDPGASDLWSEALSKTWQKIWAAPNILGSFVWEWQNQGIADKNANTTTDFYYGKDRLRQENDKGIVDEFRNPKPEWWIVKQVYSQVVVGARTVTPVNGAVDIPMTNHYSFTDLKELTCKWTAYSGSAVLETGAKHIACPPLSSAVATFDTPAGMTELRLEFDHPDGSEIVAANLPVVGSPTPSAPAALVAGSVLTTTDVADTLTVSNDMATLIFDKHTGSIRSWAVRGKSIILGGPTLNLGEAKESGERDFYRAKQTPITQNATVTASAPDSSGVVHVSVVSDVLSGTGGEPLGGFAATYDVKPDAEINVTWSLTWSGPDKSLWEEGVKFVTPAALNKIAWYRDSFFTDYPDGHIGEPSGTASITDVSFRASKRNLHWLALTDGAETGIALLQVGDTSLVSRANIGDDGTLLLASTEVSGPRDFSGSWVSDHDIRASKGKPLGGSFTLRAIAP